MRIPATSNPRPSAAPNSGTMGGVGPIGNPGRTSTLSTNMAFGDEGYLWLLVFLEVLLMGFFRNHFRRYHGG